MRTTRYLAGTGLILLMACGGEKKGGAGTQAGEETSSIAAGVTPATLLLCGADTISVQGAPEDTLQLNVNGESFVVALVPSASGAKYQAADTSTFYWNHGNRAQVQVRGEAFPECDLLPGA
jgi:membrane-bound inhibitor of C-type lysozyme